MKYSISLKKVKVDPPPPIFVEKIIKMCLIKIMAFAINRASSSNTTPKLSFMAI